MRWKSDVATAETHVRPSSRVTSQPRSLSTLAGESVFTCAIPFLYLTGLGEVCARGPAGKKDTIRGAIRWFCIICFSHQGNRERVRNWKKYHLLKSQLSTAEQADRILPVGSAHRSILKYWPDSVLVERNFVIGEWKNMRNGVMSFTLPCLTLSRNDHHLLFLFSDRTYFFFPNTMAIRIIRLHR